MRVIRSFVLAAAVGAAAAMAGAVPAQGAPVTTYAGEFAGDIVYEDCSADAAGATTGTWSVTLHGSTAKAVFAIEVDGEPHVAYTYPSMKRAPVGEGVTFSVYGPTQAGLLTVTLVGEQLSYRIAPYDFGGLSCSSVTYPGELG